MRSSPLHLCRWLTTVSGLVTAAASCGGQVAGGHGPPTSGGSRALVSLDGAGTLAAGGTVTAPVTGGGPTGAGGAMSTGTGGSPPCSLGVPCDGNGRCIELVPDGYRVCAAPVPEATHCGHAGLDQCCSTDKCATGKCLVGPLPSSLCSGGTPTNSCVADQCTSQDECGTGAVCVPAGALGRLAASCLPADCFTDSDCTLEPGGHCVPWTGPCSCYPGSLNCVYPGGCASSADCLVGACTIVSGKPVCGAPFPPCVVF
jgi:hypothetical protein